MKVGVFDSGVGGLFVTRELAKVFPGCQFVFVADSLNFPYGTKSDGQLVAVVSNMINLLERMSVDVIVVACNTASSVIERYDLTSNVELVSVIDANVQQIVENGKTRNYVILATKSTVNSQIYTKKLRGCLGEEAAICEKSCSDLVSWIEEGECREPIAPKELLRFIGDLSVQDQTTIVLGCTHFIPLRNAMRVLFPTALSVVDPVEKLKQYLREVMKSETSRNSQPPLEIYATGDPAAFSIRAQAIIGNVCVRPIPFGTHCDVEVGPPRRQK